MDGGFQSYLNRQNRWHKFTNIASIAKKINWMSLLQYLDTFLCILLEESKNSRPEEISVLINFRKFTGKHPLWCLFCNKTAGWGPATSLNRDFDTGEYWKVFKNIYFTNVCERLLLQSKIFIGVSFRTISGFYYKQNRKLFYYEKMRAAFP